MTELIGFFFKWVMRKKGFGGKWIDWIIGCLDCPFFFIMLNGASKVFWFFSGLEVRRSSFPFFVHLSDRLF